MTAPAPDPTLVPKPGEASLTGVLERIIFLNEENHYTIGELRPAKGQPSVTVVGTMPEVQCGETLELTGIWGDHPTHGKQFKARAFRATLPSSVYGIRKYLGSGLVPGIGPSFAEKIVNTFGAETLRIIEEESARLREVPGIGKKRAGEIKAAWDSQRALREVMMFLQTYGATVAQCSRIVKAYGNEAKQVLLADPYQVAREISGIGFKTADRLAINLGFANDAPARLEAGVLHVLKELESEGHTAYAPDGLVALATALLETEAEKVAAAVTRLVEARELLAAPESGLLQLPPTARAETILASALGLLAESRSALPPIKVDAAVQWAQEKAGFAFAPEQAAAVRQALTAKVSILTGGPGTGKTTILRALVDILQAKKVKLLLAAPTGRAAQRMAQSTRHHAATIHRLLKFDPAAGTFTVNAQAPLNARFVIVDEASMLDNLLASALVRAIPAEAHLLLVGDADQLPSVGAGNVLADLIQSARFPVTRLQHIFRQGAGSAVVEVAHGILAGRAQAPFVIQEGAPMEKRHDVFFLPRPDPEACVRTVTELVTRQLPAWYPTVDPIMGIQVLAPLHRGAGGIQRFNTEIQQALNPQAESVRFGTAEFRLGDKVMQTRNNYDKGVFNGDLGRISHVNTQAGTLAVDFEGSVVEYERIDLTDLTLAYAISVHKSQGSEFPLLVLPLLKQHFLLLQRNLLYTALTRGKWKVFFVGDPAAYAMAVRNTEAAIRQTDLVRKVHAASEG
ncbi:MAG: ATP-dependent RecD-like DNA helicase [Opitutales bacterium]